MNPELIAVICGEETIAKVVTKETPKFIAE